MITLVIRKSHKSIVIDPKAYETLHSFGLNNIIYIPNPIGQDVEKIAQESQYRNHHRHLGKILFVGHVIKNKGVYELVEVCTQLTEINDLTIIGPYEKYVKEELKEIAFNRESGAWLRFTGSLSNDEVLKHMYKSPLLVLPSFTEGFPNVILEAMAMGCAIIATDVGAIPEMLNIWGTKPCGICIPPKNVEKLREVIRELILDPSRIEEMGKNGIDRVLVNYTMDKIVKQYCNVWKSIAQM